VPASSLARRDGCLRSPQTFDGSVLLAKFIELTLEIPERISFSSRALIIEGTSMGPGALSICALLVALSPSTDAVGVSGAGRNGNILLRLRGGDAGDGKRHRAMELEEMGVLSRVSGSKR
jgi:hypothetical protein